MHMGWGAGSDPKIAVVDQIHSEWGVLYTPKPNVLFF